MRLPPEACEYEGPGWGVTKDSYPPEFHKWLARFVARRKKIVARAKGSSSKLRRGGRSCSGKLTPQVGSSLFP